MRNWKFFDEQGCPDYGPNYAGPIQTTLIGVTVRKWLSFWLHIDLLELTEKSAALYKCTTALKVVHWSAGCWPEVQKGPGQVLCDHMIFLVWLGREGRTEVSFDFKTYCIHWISFSLIHCKIIGIHWNSLKIIEKDIQSLNEVQM